MVTKQDIEAYESWHDDKYGGDPPIYRIIVFRNPDKELVYENGARSGAPDTGGENDMGFYYDLNTAIRAMHGNWCDIHETCFQAGFILCQYPGLYECAVSEARIYFLWDEEKGGFFEAEEPEIFQHVAF